MLPSGMAAPRAVETSALTIARRESGPASVLVSWSKRSSSKTDPLFPPSLQERRVTSPTVQVGCGDVKRALSRILAEVRAWQCRTRLTAGERTGTLAAIKYGGAGSMKGVFQFTGVRLGLSRIALI